MKSRSTLWNHTQLGFTAQNPGGHAGAICLELLIAEARCHDESTGAGDGKRMMVVVGKREAADQLFGDGGGIDLGREDYWGSRGKGRPRARQQAGEVVQHLGAVVRWCGKQLAGSADEAESRAGAAQAQWRPGAAEKERQRGVAGCAEATSGAVGAASGYSEQVWRSNERVERAARRGQRVPANGCDGVTSGWGRAVGRGGVAAIEGAAVRRAGASGIVGGEVGVAIGNGAGPGVIIKRFKDQRNPGTAGKRAAESGAVNRISSPGVQDRAILCAMLFPECAPMQRQILEYREDSGPNMRREGREV
ncbi:hypothetical protein B0H14DRAFT_2611488 [Mycena olivaceomarginata]|nr:hypothetical protein B0H14DRAFT_2611488 [Mycena olivaceomarginata]